MTVHVCVFVLVSRTLQFEVFLHVDISNCLCRIDIHSLVAVAHSESQAIVVAVRSLVKSWSMDDDTKE